MADPTQADREKAQEVAEHAQYRGQKVLVKLIAQALTDQRAPLVPNGPNVTTERITITNPTNGPATYTGETPDGGTELSGFAGDIAHEVTYGLVEGHDIDLVEITVRWRGSY